MILLVEDDDSLRSRYAFALAFAGFVVLEARSGYEALQRLERRRPDLVILDSTLPGIDSDAVSAELASNPDTSTIPVMILTTTVSKSRAFKACCTLPKPLAAWRLVESVRRCLNTAESSG